ncbi:MAG: calcium-binding protein [Beijerinckiaceae bacterium]|nr:calcium-binding protein [Beijerinckiaceae bacterium]
MAADGNTAPIATNATTETPVSGDQQTIMPVIVQDTTGAISRDGLSSINKPDAGTIRVIDTGNLPELNFSFAASDVKLTALDVDLVMIFKDNSKIILPTLAMDLVGANPPRLTFKGSAASPQAVVAQIGQTTLVDITPSVQLASPDFLPKKKGGNTNDADQNALGHNGIGGGEPPLPPQPVVSGAKSGKSGENDGAKTQDFTAPPVEKVQPGSITTGSNANAFSSALVIPPINRADPLNSATAYSFSQVPVFAKMYQIVEAHPQQTGTNIFYGGSGTSPADTISTFAAQSMAETLTGTDAADNIYADNKTYSAGGMAGRVISISPSLANGFVMNSLVISGVPSTIKIIDGTALGGDETHGYSYKINAYAKGTSEFRFQIAYQVPESIDPQNTIDSKSALSLTFSGIKIGTTQAATATGSVYFNVAEVANDAEQITSNYTDGITVVNLSFHPAGNSIAGGAGNDTIHAAAGADTIDGGTGDNWLYYDMSRLGVKVDLRPDSLGLGHGNSGFATGDTYINIHNVLGSTAADTLIGDDFGDSLYGNGGHDSILGGRGNDYFKSNSAGSTIDGGDGFDKLDFSDSMDAITVDINSGTAAPATNTGYDIIRNIEAIVGTSKGDDMLISGTAGSWLDAGDGNDTLISGAGADTLYAGAGIDTLSYVNSTTGVTVDLSAMTATGGYATGDVIQDFENVIGSNQDDVLIGSTGANVLDGRDGNDSINGGGGNDTLLGGAGNDTIAAGAGQNSIDGGDNNDIIFASNGKNTIDGGEGTDTVDYSTASGKLNLTLFDSDVTEAKFVGSSKKDTLINVENIIATSDDDTVFGNSSDNSIDGRDGNDYLSGGYGNDSLDGGAGSNWISYDYLRSSDGPYRLQVAGSAPLTVAISATETDVVQNIENLQGSKGDDLIIGDELKNSLYGGDGNDTILGGNGNDTLNASTDFDSIDGGSGSADTVDYTYIVAGGGSVDLHAVSVGSAAWTATIFNAASQQIGTEYIVNIEKFLGIQGSNNLNFDGSSANLSIAGGSTGNATLTGGFGNDYLTGALAGSNILTGGTGNNTLIGGGINADNTFIGGLGNDSIVGNSNAHTNVVDYAYFGNNQNAGKTFSLALTSAGISNNWTGKVYNGANLVKTDTLVDISSIHLGSSFNIVNLSGLTAGLNVTIDGSSYGAIDTIITGAGNDCLMGDGDDSLDGGAGNDTIIGGSGNDSIDAGTGNDTVNVNYVIGTSSVDGGAGNDILSTYAGAPWKYVMNSNGVIGQLTSGATYVTNFTNFESLYGGGSADIFVGSANSNGLYVSLGASNDTLDDGGQGSNMTLDGGNGDDTYFLRSTLTRIVDTAQTGDTGIDTVYTTLTSVDLSSSQMGGQFT